MQFAILSCVKNSRELKNHSFTHVEEKRHIYRIYFRYSESLRFMNECLVRQLLSFILDRNGQSVDLDIS